MCFRIVGVVAPVLDNSRPELSLKLGPQRQYRELSREFDAYLDIPG